MIRGECQACGRRFRAPDAMAGKRAACRVADCDGTVRFPGDKAARGHDGGYDSDGGSARSPGPEDAAVTGGAFDPFAMPEKQVEPEDTRGAAGETPGEPDGFDFPPLGLDDVGGPDIPPLPGRRGGRPGPPDARVGIALPREVGELFGPNESVLYSERPSPLILVAEIAVRAVPGLLVLVGLLVVPGGAATRWQAAFGVLFVTAAAVAWAIASWNNRVFVVTDRHVVCRVGVLNRAIRLVRVGHVCAVTINTGIVDRLLGLSRVKFATSASASLPISGWFADPGAVVFSRVDSTRVLEAFRGAGTGDVTGG